MLPLGDAAIWVPPNGIAPTMTDLSLLENKILVDINAQTRPLRNVDEAIVKGEYVWIAEVVGQVIGLVVVNTLTLLLNEGVLAHCVYL